MFYYVPYVVPYVPYVLCFLCSLRQTPFLCLFFPSFPSVLIGNPVFFILTSGFRLIITNLQDSRRDPVSPAGIGPFSCDA